MKIDTFEFSVVVAGQDCNPTILNPDFLRCQGIVPEEWRWEVVGPVITTPPFATVAYSSGITIKVEPNRFQVTDQKTASNLAESKAADIARRYIEVLPHVRYTGVGINFRSFVEMDQPDHFLNERFLRKGPWDKEGNPLLGVNLKFMYDHENGQLNLSMEGGTLVQQEGREAIQRNGVLTHANYHRDCQGHPAHEMVLDHISRAPSDQKHINIFLDQLLATAVE